MYMIIVCVCVCMHACVRGCVRVRVCVYIACVFVLNKRVVMKQLDLSIYNSKKLLSGCNVIYT